MKGEAGSVGGEEKAKIPRMHFASNNPVNVASEEKSF